MEQIQTLLSKKVENINISATLDTRHLTPETEKIPVIIRVNCNRRHYYYPTGYKFTLKEYDKLCKSTGKGASNKTAIWETKKELLAIFEKVEKAIKDLSDSGLFNFENLKTRLTGRSSETFLDIWRGIISDCKKHNTKDSYKNAMGCLVRYAGSNIAFDRIGPAFIREWIWDMDKKGLSKTTQAIYLRSIKVPINECIRLGRIKQSQYPFGKGKGQVVIPKAAKRTEDFIGIATIRRIMGFVAPEGWSQSYADAVHQSIGFWLFSYLAGGMNVADMAEIQWNEYYFGQGKESDLSFIRQKVEDSNGEKTYIAISPAMRKILDKYGSTPELGKRIFPQILGYEHPTPEQTARRVQQVNANIRAHLGKVCKVLEIPFSVSPTWARHSFKSNAAHLGLPHDYVEFSMGHSIQGVAGNYLGAFPLEQRLEYADRLLGETASNPFANLSPDEMEAVLNLLKTMRK